MSKELANRITGSNNRDLNNGTIMSTFLGGCGVALVACIFIAVYRRFKQKGKSEQTEKSSIKPSTMFSDPAPLPFLSDKIVGPVFNQVAARNTFMKNINRFTPKLHTLTDNTYSDKDVMEDWFNEIIDLNDRNLTQLWELIYKDENAVKRMFAQWGLSPDQCISFYAFKMHTDMYQTEDGGSVKEGVSYNVMSPCWILTTHDKDSGKDVKAIILKGVAK